MTMLRDGRFIPIEQDRDEDDGPDEAYFMAVAGEYALGSPDGSAASQRVQCVERSCC